MASKAIRRTDSPQRQHGSTRRALTEMLCKDARTTDNKIVTCANKMPYGKPNYRALPFTANTLNFKSDALRSMPLAQAINPSCLLLALFSSGLFLQRNTRTTTILRYYGCAWLGTLTVWADILSRKDAHLFRDTPVPQLTIWVAHLV